MADYKVGITLRKFDKYNRNFQLRKCRNLRFPKFANFAFFKP